LADYERLAHEVVATEDSLRRTLFGPRAAAETLLAYADVVGAVVAPVGFALFFGNYSTFLGQAGVYLEDLFVLPAFRGQASAARCSGGWHSWPLNVRPGAWRWAVLDWNEPALKFYRAMGAQSMDEWTVHDDRAALSAAGRLK